MSLASKLKRARGLPPKFVAEEILRRIKSHAVYRVRKLKYSISPPKIGDKELLKKTGQESTGALIEKIDANDLFFFGKKNKKEILGALEKDPKEKKATMAAAQNFIAHKFALLGSGGVNLGKEIPWNLDFVSGKTWDNKYYKDIKTIRFDGSDIKVPWELSRCGHFVTLGKAYWYTGNEKYAKEFVGELHDWIEKNPVDFSPNWAVSMEAAIRAVNWIWAYYFFAESKEFTIEAKKGMLKSLYFHAKHIMENTEYNGPYSGNHYFSNGIGLLYLGLFLSPFNESEKWRNKGIEIILDSMQNQVLPDGVDFEKSTAYHRLVTDFAVHAHLLCKKNNIPLPSWFEEKLFKMIGFIAAYTKPDGTAPLIGDADDGRLVILEDGKNINDHRHHLSTGAVLFKNSLFKSQAGKFHEESLWLLGAGAKKEFEKINEVAPKSAAFPDGGFFIMRNGRNHMFIDCGGIGLRGLGGHGHNDVLSFELFAGDKTFITDSGTYTYSRDYGERARFRKTSAHNTVEVDGKEMAPFEEKELWQIKDITNAKCLEWDAGKEKDIFAGQHTGYNRLGNIVVKRKITFDKLRAEWLVEDEITGSGEHELALYFHFAPMPLALEENRLVTKAKGANILLEMLKPKTARIELIKDFVSYSYGMKAGSKTLKITQKTGLPAIFKTRISVLK